MCSGLIRSNACVRLRRRTGAGRVVGRAFREMSSTSSKSRQPEGQPPFQILPPQRPYLYPKSIQETGMLKQVMLLSAEGKQPPLHPQGERPPASADDPLPPSRRTNFVPTRTSSGPNSEIPNTSTRAPFQRHGTGPRASSNPLSFLASKPYSGTPAFGVQPPSSGDAPWPKVPPTMAFPGSPPSPDAEENTKPRQPEGPAPYTVRRVLGRLIAVNAPGKAPSTAFSIEPSQPPEGPATLGVPRRIPHVHVPPQGPKYPPAFENRPATPLIHRAVYINNLPRSTTLTDVTQAIAAVGPIGTILSAKLTPASKGHDDRISAVVEFNRKAAAGKLIARAKQGNFTVNGVTPWVGLNKHIAFRDELTGIRHSRVLRITGPPGVPGFTQACLRALLNADTHLQEVMRGCGASNYLGFESEPPREYMTDDGSGNKVIEWAFFSTAYQTIPILMSLRRQFHRKLHVDQALDPCNIDKAGRPREQETPAGQTPSDDGDQRTEGFQFMRKQ